MATRGNEVEGMEGLVVAVYQGSSCPYGSIDRNLEAVRNSAEAAADKGAKLLLFPELFLNGYDAPKEHLHATSFYFSNPSPALELLQHTARSNRIALCVPYAERASHDPTSTDAFRRFRA